MKVRVGIDVGGTFTDAVCIDNDTYELIGYLKIPTTHTEKEGVSKGVVVACQKLLEQCDIAPEDVVFIAHGTTQATNALLEGDVEKVGIIGVGESNKAYKVKMDTQIGDIELITVNGNDCLTKCYTTVQSQFMIANHLIVDYRFDEHRESIESHANLLQCLKSKDIDGAKEILRIHILGAQNRILQQMENRIAE